MKRLTILIFLSLLIGSPMSFAQEDSLVTSCKTCHGDQGISNNNLWPNLAGQKKEYLIKQLKAFRSDERKDPIMNPMTKNLSDNDIEKLSEYFSKLK